VTLIQTNPQTCKRDGNCSQVCPLNLIEYSQGELPTAVADIDGLCIRCGHCVAVCTPGSLFHAEVRLYRCPPKQEELAISAEQAEQFLRSRRSIRNYRKKSVPLELLQKMIETAGYAPSAHNTQGAEWLVLSDPVEMKPLVGLVGDWMRWMLDAMPIVAMSVHLDKALERLEAGDDVVLREAPVLILVHGRKDDRMASTTCTIALSHLELAAAGQGLGACWAGYFSAAASNYPPMVAALDLPDAHICYGAMMLGYPQYDYHRMPERKVPVIRWR